MKSWMESFHPTRMFRAWNTWTWWLVNAWECGLLRQSSIDSAINRSSSKTPMATKFRSMLGMLLLYQLMQSIMMPSISQIQRNSTQKGFPRKIGITFYHSLIHPLELVSHELSLFLEITINDTYFQAPEIALAPDSLWWNARLWCSVSCPTSVSRRMKRPMIQSNWNQIPSICAPKMDSTFDFILGINLFPIGFGLAWILIAYYVEKLPNLTFGLMIIFVIFCWIIQILMWTISKP